MGNIGSILESLTYNRLKDELIAEAVKVAYDDAAKMKKSSRIIRKAFGKITSPKEEWYDMSNLMQNVESEDSPLMATYRTKYFSVNASYQDFPITEALEALCRITNIPYERILKILYKVSKERFHIEQISNLRMIFQSDRNKNHRVELRYDRKLFKKDHKDDGLENEVESPSETQEDEKITREIKEADIQQEALEHKEEDDRKVIEKRKWVEATKSNRITAFKKERVNEAAIKKDSGASSTVAKASAAVADDLFEVSAKEEPNISKEIVDVVRRLGGTMFGLDFRLKQPTSLGRKIATDVSTDIASFGGDVNKAAKEIKDTIRYTAIYDLDDFTEKYFATKRNLERLGYVELRCKNFYTQYAAGKSQQKAIQCVYFKKPNGIMFELQFHTVESQGVKEVNHPLYEEWRKDDTTIERKAVLDQRMKNLGAEVPDPVGVFDIPEHK